MRVMKISMNAPRITVWAGLASAKTSAYIRKHSARDQGISSQNRPGPPTVRETLAGASPVLSKSFLKLKNLKNYSSFFFHSEFQQF